MNISKHFKRGAKIRIYTNIFYFAKFDPIYTDNGAPCVFLVDDIKNINRPNSWRRFSQSYIAENITQ